MSLTPDEVFRLRNLITENSMATSRHWQALGSGASQTRVRELAKEETRTWDALQDWITAHSGDSPEDAPNDQCIKCGAPCEVGAAYCQRHQDAWLRLKDMRGEQ